MNFLIAHFRKHRARRPFDFFWRLSLEQFVISAVVLAVTNLAGAGDREMPSLPPMVLAKMVIIVAPILETIGLQMIPLEIMRLLKVRLWLQLAFCTALFFFLHAREDIGTGLTAGLVGGFYLSFIYTQGRTWSWWTATWMTAGAHCINNLLAFTFAMLSDN